MKDAPRPLFKRWWFRLVIGIALIIIVGAIVVRRPGAIAKRLAAIRAAGLPAEFSEIENFYPQIPSDENGAPLLLNALSRISLDNARALPERSEEWNDELRIWAATQLERNTEPAAELHSALQKQTGWRFPIVLKGNPATVPLPHLSVHRGGANWLKFRAIHSAVTGDRDGSAVAILDAIRLARTLDGEPLFISSLVRTAELAIAATSLEQTLSRTSLDDQRLRELQAALIEAAQTNVLWRAMVGERAFGVGIFMLPPGEIGRTIGTVHTIGQTGSSSTEEILTATLMAFYSASGLKDRDQAFYLDVMEQAVAAAEITPDLRALSVMKDFDNLIEKHSQQWSHVISRLLLPALGKTVLRQFRNIATLRSAATACAIERYRLASGTLPDSLSTLVPQFLDRIPIDPMNSEPLKYRRLDRGYVVYSIGAYETDDGGGVEFEWRPKKRSNGQDYTFTVAR